ncbi:MAG TPA: surface-adhesin E family protein [Rhodocyclaceae bacterium]|nr:surface-adhesin E family protein [Rhodocyclaceae bacterium]
MSFKQILLLVGSLLACQAHAANWALVDSNSESKIFLDTESVRRNGSKVKVWIKWSHSAPVAAKNTYPEKQYQSSKSLDIYDCSDRSSASIQFILYADADGGEVVKSDSIPERLASFREVVPDSIGEAILEAACKRSGSKK